MLRGLWKNLVLSLKQFEKLLPELATCQAVQHKVEGVVDVLQQEEEAPYRSSPVAGGIGDRGV